VRLTAQVQVEVKGKVKVKVKSQNSAAVKNKYHGCAVDKDRNKQQ
jgi:hypothetical protein